MFTSLPALLLSLPLLAALLFRFLPARGARAAAGAGALLLLLFITFASSLPLDFSAPVTWATGGLTWQLSAGGWGVIRILYLGTAFLYLLALVWPAPPQDSFVPATLAALAPLAAALMLPFPLAAAAFFLATLPVIMSVRPGGVPVPGRGMLLYFVFTALAIPLLLLAGWMLLSEQLVFANVIWRLVVVALLLLLAGFPFHIWVRQLVAELYASYAPALPYLFGLVHLVLLAVIFQFLQRAPSLEHSDQFVVLLQWSGVGAALVGALLAWKPETKVKLLGALLLLDLGATLAAVSLGSAGIGPTLLLLQGRFLGLLLFLGGWALMPTALAEADNSSLSTLLRLSPLPTLLLLYGALTLLGLPLTPGFPGRWAVLSLVAARSLWPAFFLLMGLAGGTVALLDYFLPRASAGMAGDHVVQAGPLPLKALLFFLLMAAVLLALYPDPILSLASELVVLFAA